MPVRYDETKLAAARLNAASLQPFLASALYALQPCQAPGLGTFGVDERWRLYVDPEPLLSWSVDEVAGVLLHEVGHVVRAHAARAKAAFVDGTSSTRWNIAGDAEINDDLLRDGAKLPGKPVTPRALSLPAGKVAEYYFLRLEGRVLEPHADCGAGAHGVDREAEIAGRVIGRLPIGVDELEGELIRRKVALAVLSGRNAGHGHGGWSRWAEAFAVPVVSWRRLLASQLRGAVSASVAGNSDYRYARPSRRQVPGVVLPGLVRPIPTIGVVIDTSASVGDRLLAAAWTEVLAMLQAVGVRRERVVVWSTDVVATRLDGRLGRRVALTGGGGTDMSAGIAAAARARPRPDVIVVLTDGETPWPAVAPAQPVIVGMLLDGVHDPGPVPPWARRVDIPTDSVEATAFAELR